MHTAPGQIATTVEINPGVPVRDGTLRFRLLDPQRVEVEGGRWPFAGGELVLEPTLLDFSERRERRMTFRVVGADAALFLKEMEFENLDATGTFDGTLPMIFDAQGGRIEGGALRARAGGSLAYVGEISQRDLGFWGNMAFQALKALDYRSLTIGMNGPLAGDMVTEIRFAGVSQGKGTKSNFLLRRLAKLPFVFNVRVSAPFHQLLDSVQSWYDPNRLIERNLPTLLQEQEQSGGKAGAPAPVQPRESENLR
nr:YdbH domain-containing protein [Sphingomonas naasensis]